MYYNENNSKTLWPLTILCKNAVRPAYVSPAHTA